MNYDLLRVWCAMAQRAKFDNFYFVPLTEFEFLIMAGISQVIKKYYAGKTILLLPAHPRVRNKMENYYKQFDEVTFFPYCNYRHNLIKGYRDFLLCYNAINKYQFQPNSILFMVSSRQLVQAIFLKLFKKKCEGSISYFVQVLPYAENKQNMRLNLARSIFMNCYSLLFLQRFIYCVCDRKHPGYIGYRAKSDWDFRVNIEHTGENGNFITFHNIPFPTSFIDSSTVDFSQGLYLKKKGVIFFLDTTIPRLHGIDEEKYWKVSNEIINAVINNNQDINVYVKLHPACDEDEVSQLIRSDVIWLDKDIPAEEYYLANQNKILAVFSTGSTVLLSALWMGIPAYSYSDMVGYSGTLRQRFLKYLSLGKNIRHIHNLNEVATTRFIKKEDETGCLGLKMDKWKRVIDGIMRSTG